jgi:hypothetical protein
MNIKAKKIVILLIKQIYFDSPNLFGKKAVYIVYRLIYSQNAEVLKQI